MRLRPSLVAALAVSALLWGALVALAQAVVPQVQVCWQPITDPDTTHINLYIGGVIAQPSLDTGAVTAAGKTCSTITLPTAATRGTPQPWTLKSVNTLGEESAASNVVTFRIPNLSVVPVALSVGFPVSASPAPLPSPTRTP